MRAERRSVADVVPFKPGIEEHVRYLVTRRTARKESLPSEANSSTRDVAEVGDGVALTTVTVVVALFVADEVTL